MTAIVAYKHNNQWHFGADRLICNSDFERCECTKIRNTNGVIWGVAGDHGVGLFLEQMPNLFVPDWEIYNRKHFRNMQSVLIMLKKSVRYTMLVATNGRIYGINDTSWVAFKEDETIATIGIADVVSEYAMRHSKKKTPRGILTEGLKAANEMYPDSCGDTFDFLP